MIALLAAALLSAGARRHVPPRRHPAAPAPARVRLDPAVFFASHTGLVRIYESRSKPETDDAAPPGASCQVLDARPRSASAPGSVRESCTMIVGRKPKSTTQLAYELRDDGIHGTEAQPEGGEKVALDRLVLPAPLAVGRTWTEDRGPAVLVRRVESAGRGCRAAGREFADCLVLAVEEKQGRRVVKRYSETYAEGVGLVEDAQWELVDVKGL